MLLLQRGFKTGSILTVDPADAQRLGEPWTRRYIYGQAKCGECGSKTSVYGECRTAEQTRRRCVDQTPNARLCSGSEGERD